MDDLKPCPFCGGKSISDDTYSICCPVEWFGQFRCCDCDTVGPLSEYKHDNQEDAQADGAKAWNARAITPQEAAKVLAKAARLDYAIECDTCEAMGQQLRSWSELTYFEKSRMVTHLFASALRAIADGTQ